MSNKLTAEECKARALVNSKLASFLDKLVAFDLVDREAGLQVHRALSRRANKKGK